MPVRIRVTLAFTLAMAVLLAALGAFLYLQMRADLDETLDDNLRSRLGEVSGLVAGGAPSRGDFSSAFGDEDETFVQVLRPTGELAYSTPAAGDTPLVTPDEIPPAGSQPAEIERSSVPGLDGGARILAAPFDPDTDLAVIVGASLDDRDETLSRLLALLLIGGPVALILASLAGYWAAGRALHPVEAMRRRAAEISAGDPGERLPVPPVDDELGRLGATLNEMLGRLEAAIERERRFVDDASHELRTPLALHRAELELALRYGDDAASLRSSIASAIEEVDRLVALAEALLVVARSGEDGLAITREQLTAGELFDAAIERFRTRAAKANRALVVGEGRELEITGDRLRLDQALAGLADNALRHGAGDVRLWAEPAAGHVVLHVTDAGAGFPEDFLPHAFERFSRADSARGRGGAGLGLAIVDTIAAAHGGSAQARNLPGGGADVSIALPADIGSARDVT
jgi:two-component system, OmpR family, sensor kinase